MFIAQGNGGRFKCDRCGKFFAHVTPAETRVVPPKDEWSDETLEHICGSCVTKEPPEWPPPFE